MKWLLRLIVNGATALSMILCVATLVLWVRSYSYNENLHWFGDGRELSLRSSRGQVDCYRVWASNLRSRPTEFNLYRQPATYGLAQRIVVLNRDSGMWHIGPILGFAFFRNAHPTYAELFVEIMAPWWSLTLLTAALPATGLRRSLKRRRAVRPGCCAACGYDLRATPGRCPECGRVPAVVKEG